MLNVCSLNPDGYWVKRGLCWGCWTRSISKTECLNLRKHTWESCTQRPVLLAIQLICRLLSISRLQTVVLCWRGSGRDIVQLFVCHKAPYTTSLNVKHQTADRRGSWPAGEHRSRSYYCYFAPAWPKWSWQNELTVHNPIQILVIEILMQTEFCIFRIQDKKKVSLSSQKPRLCRGLI